MSLEMNDLFRERFQGHESPVDPGAWDAIQSKLAMGAPAADPVIKLFQEKFQGHEAPVDPSAWSNISSQLGHPAATGISSVWGWAAAGVTALVIGGAALFMTNDPAVELADIPQDPKEIHIPTLVSTTVPAKVDAPIPAEQELIISNSAVLKSVAPAKLAQAVSLGIEHISPDPIVTEPVDGSVKGAPEAKEEDPVKTDAEFPEPIDGPIIVAQIIDELTTKAAEAAKNVLENAKPELSSSATTSVADEPNEDNTDQPLTDLKPMAPLPELFIPNTFTPNGDNINDTFEVIAEGYERSWFGSSPSKRMFRSLVPIMDPSGMATTVRTVITLLRLKQLPRMADQKLDLPWFGSTGTG